MEETPLSLTYLEELFATLQGLHQNLSTANASGIMDSVHALSSLLSRPVRAEAEALAREPKAARTSLVARIMALQHVNQTLCEGGLKTLQRFSGFAEKPSAYTSEGRMDRAPLADVNVSA
jgi:hypothetical protein